MIPAWRAREALRERSRPEAWMTEQELQQGFRLRRWANANREPKAVAVVVAEEEPKEPAVEAPKPPDQIPSSPNSLGRNENHGA